MMLLISTGLEATTRRRVSTTSLLQNFLPLSALWRASLVGNWTDRHFGISYVFIVQFDFRTMSDK